MDALSSDLSNAELAVLGAVVKTAGEALDDLVLTGDDFNDKRNGDLFDLMRSMRANGEHVDQQTVAARVPDRAALVWSLSDHTPFAYAVDSYAAIVASHGMYRRLRSVADALNGLSGSLPVEVLTERARELVDEAVGQQKSKVRFIRDILPAVIDRVEAEDMFVPSPWPSLNATIGGFRPGAVYVVGARPGIGKTVVAAQVAAELSKHGAVAFSSLEMSEGELVARLVSERLEIYVSKLKGGTMDGERMTDFDWGKIAARKHEVADLAIAVDDRASVSPTDIRNFARSVSRHQPLSGVVVDYLQLMASTSKSDRHVQVSEFSRQMKILAKDMQVPVILLSQLNRQSEARADGAPKLSELRESGAIEQDADVVILLSRKEHWNGRDELLVMDVAKNRHGKTNVIELAWQGEFSRAVEWDS